ncbi:TPM domain-containing protein [Actinomyces lilanjuaniae]|uniref:TPM domain-containing protein n=1 Tax=Actinomyces lilanjuaniae TaxID=2321394 RepID=A0ABN5PU01_9ACTO|nr:TPM domain-containing protein [Actinomyces lilanjuaniae]AYD90455.1 TPM domain-containing protein [Actinomyces lilanjuaniae]
MPHTLPSPARALTLLTACGLLLAGGLAVPASALTAPAADLAGTRAALSALPALPGLPAYDTGYPLSSDASGSPTILTSHVTDELGILDRSAAEDVVARMASDYGVGLWVLTVSDSGRSAADLASAVLEESGLGEDAAVLVVNIPSDNPSARTYSFQTTAATSRISDSQLDRIDDALRQALSKQRYDAAVASIPESMSASGSVSPAVVSLGVGALAVGGGAAAWAAVRRRRRSPGAASATSAGTRGEGQPDALSLEELRVRAGSALVDADDTVRSAAEELSYAQAQFGLSATDAFTAALDRAREHVARSFELRQRLDDEIPETEAQQRQMSTEILGRCEAAVEEIRVQAEAFSQRRGIEASLPTSIAETTQRADETEQSITVAESLLVTLHAAYPQPSLSSVSQAPEQARRLLAAGRTALEQARSSVEQGQNVAAVEQVRIAQGAIAQAGDLAAQVTTARERLQGAGKALEAAIASISSDLVDAQRLADAVPEATLRPLVDDAQAAVEEGRAASGPTPSADPLAALDHLERAEAAIDAALASAREQEENISRARASVGSRLSRLGSQVEAVTAYITTHRGVVGASARTALSEASRHASAASAVQEADPVAALAEVAAGEPLVAQAQALAEADVRGGSGPSGSFGGPGADALGALVLGGILFGGGSGPRRYGGWGAPGPRPGAGFGGGGGFRGRGGGFGGGSGSRGRGGGF